MIELTLEILLYYFHELKTVETFSVRVVIQFKCLFISSLKKLNYFLCEDFGWHNLITSVAFLLISLLWLSYLPIFFNGATWSWKLWFYTSKFNLTFPLLLWKLLCVLDWIMGRENVENLLWLKRIQSAYMQRVQKGFSRYFFVHPTKKC